MLLTVIKPIEFTSDGSVYPASEGLAALRADEGSGDEVGVVVASEVHVQQLLLSEGLLTLAAGVRFLSGVGSTVHHHVTLLETEAWGTFEKQSYTLEQKEQNLHFILHRKHFGLT